MNDDEIVRAALRERLLDRVPLPSDASREVMFTRTLAAAPGSGAELLPPDDLFDPRPGDEQAGDVAGDPAVPVEEPDERGEGGSDGSAVFDDGGPGGHDVAPHDGDLFGHGHPPHDPGDHPDPGHTPAFDQDGPADGGGSGGSGW